MSHDKKKKGIKDRQHVSLKEDHEVRFWSHKFGVSKEELQRVVNEVGPSTHAVEEALKSRQSGDVGPTDERGLSSDARGK